MNVMADLMSNGKALPNWGIHHVVGDEWVTITVHIMTAFSGAAPIERAAHSHLNTHGSSNSFRVYGEPTIPMCL
ncbi:hypothetical protein D3C76_1461660 [compost metagenome]